MKNLELEVFCDPFYYDMWCVKPVDCKDFDLTIHFDTKREAEHAVAVIEEWFKECGK